MRPSPTSPLEAFIQTIQDWSELAYPVLATDEPVALLTHVWVMLAETVCSRQQQEYAELIREIGQVTITEKNGRPPIAFFRKRLHELADAGVHDGFLAIAMREAMETLIQTDCPEASGRWKLLADRNLPLWMRFAHMGNQSAPSRSTYRPPT